VDYIVQNMDDVRFTVPIKIKSLKLISEYKTLPFNVTQNTN
jgi:hypothetical protein